MFKLTRSKFLVRDFTQHHRLKINHVSHCEAMNMSLREYLNDEMKYESFMRRMRKKSIVNVTRKKKEIREE